MEKVINTVTLCGTFWIIFCGRQDLYFTNENVDSVGDVLNFDKRRMLAQQIDEICFNRDQTYDKVNPALVPDKGIQAYLAVAILR